MNRHPTDLLAFTLGCAAASSACSGTSRNPISSDASPCGPGTLLSQGECVPAEGGQPNADGAPSSDSSVSPSDAASEGMSAGDVSDTSTAPYAPSDSGSSDVRPAPDPCPTGDIILNCDPQCGATQSDVAACAMSSCPSSVVLFSASRNAMFVRTPASPGGPNACLTQCPNGGLVFAVGVDTPTSLNMTVRVGAPWMILPFIGTNPSYCADSGVQATAGCKTFPARWGGTIYIVTSDPNAPARNVEIEEGPDAAPCP